MITPGQAHELLRVHLSNSPRATHSVFVGYVMRCLAQRFGGDPELWEVVGLCHDLDYFGTTDDRSQHGIVVADWLKNDLPPDALDAIKAHDHRTGIHASTVLADALKLADALAIADALLGRKSLAVLRDSDGEKKLRAIIATRPYLSDMIAGISRKHGLSWPKLADICEAAPVQ
ncbi:MAG: HD domain-containing protein [Mesorhizobium sp.]|nr:MAG: HD domain-containing protein [Mesorhizobium sp.]RWJ12020.1 MAG: HD domain-containing protein [Mesorhizobium sp.]